MLWLIVPPSDSARGRYEGGTAKRLFEGRCDGGSAVMGRRDGWGAVMARGGLEW